VKTHKEMTVKYLLLLPNCNQKWNMLTDCSKMYQQQVRRTYNPWFFCCYICRGRQTQWS